MGPSFEIKVSLRTRRWHRAKRLLWLLALTRSIMPGRLWRDAVRYVICSVLIIEMRIGQGRWQRVRIRPEEVEFA